MNADVTQMNTEAAGMDRTVGADDRLRLYCRWHAGVWLAEKIARHAAGPEL